MKKILTKKERTIFNLLVLGYSTLDIAERLSLSDKTVRNHISNVIQKLGVMDRGQAIVELIKLKEIIINPQ